jgi:hypothetical protein
MKMKNILNNLMTSAVLVFALGSGLEAQTIRLNAMVPFAWNVSGAQVNAGELSITRDGSSRVMLIQNKTDGKTTALMTIPAETHNVASRLVCHRYGDRYFLAGIVAPGVKVANLPVTSAEREAMQAQPHDVATIFVDIQPTGN